MTVETTRTDVGQLTEMLETLGVDDRDIEDVRTVTMGRTQKPMRQTPMELVDRLPRLLRGGDTDTIPELRIKGTLGEGGMGLVELAEQLSLGRDVAVKKVRDDAKSDRATMVLLREGWTTGVLEHPNIVPVYALGRNEQGEPVIVMKKIAGTSWLDIIEDPSQVPDGFDADDPIELHVEILAQVCNAIHYAHSRGIIHRDLKPENVMLGEFGEVYVLDWGIAVSIDDDPTGRLAMAGDVKKPAGTPAYMAPEMVDGDGELLGVHTDIFLLGAMFFEALTGAPPYSGKTLFAIMIDAHECPSPTFDDSIAPELAAICRRAMARDPDARFDSARQLHNALHEYRRHRQARRLASQGDNRLAEVRHRLNREQAGDDIDDRALYKVFGECRFAYEQSLEIAADNRRALDGLQQALELMAGRELQQKAPKAASLLISDLPRPNEELERRLDELEEQLATRQKDYEELQQIRHDVDVEVGRGSRTIFAIVMGLLWTVMSLSLAVGLEKSIVELSYPRMVTHGFLLTALIGAIIYFGRHRFFENKLNQRMLIGVFIVFCCVTVFRITVWINEIPYRAAASQEMLLYLMAALLLAVTLDRRIVVTGIPFLFSSVAGAIWPSNIFWFFAAANVVSMGLLIWLWWPEDPEKALCATGATS